MSIKIAMRQMVLGLFMLVGIWGLPFQVEAGEAESWVVRSEYQSPVPGRGKSTIWWRFESRYFANGEAQVAVSDVNGRIKARAEFYYDQAKGLVQVDCYRHLRGEEICDARIYDAGAPVIMNQTLIPGDWLNREQPFAVREEVKEYLVKEKVGVTGFSSRLSVQESELSLAEAIASGMVEADNELSGQGKRLRLVTVTKVMGLREEVLMRQLWAVGDDFWLYEEKGGRRSWRCAGP